MKVRNPKGIGRIKKQLEEQLIDIIDKMPTGKDSDLIIYKGKMMTVLKFRKRLLNDKRKS